MTRDEAGAAAAAADGAGSVGDEAPGARFPRGPLCFPW